MLYFVLGMVYQVFQTMIFVGGMRGRQDWPCKVHIFRELWIWICVCFFYFSVKCFGLLCDFFGFLSYHHCSIRRMRRDSDSEVLINFKIMYRCIMMLHIQCACYELRLPLVFHRRITFEIFEPLWNLEYTTGAPPSNGVSAKCASSRGTQVW